MDEITFKILVAFAVFSATGWMFLLIGLRLRRRQRHRDEQETTRTAGRITGYVQAETPGGKGGKNSYLKPVVEFTVYERKYRQEYENRLDQSRFPVGGSVEVLCDANDPVHFHLSEDEAYGRGARNAVRIGVVWIILSLAVVILMAVFVGGYSPDSILYGFGQLFGLR